MKENSKRNKHMTLEDRLEIQECLGKGMTFKAIARRIEKSQTTVSREIKLHVKPYTNGFTKTDGVCPQLLKAPYLGPTEEVQTDADSSKSKNGYAKGGGSLRSCITPAARLPSLPFQGGSPLSNQVRIAALPSRFVLR